MVRQRVRSAANTQPKQVFDIKEFLELLNKTPAPGLTVKYNADCVKFKARTARRLITLVVKDADKADKLVKLVPPTIKPKFIKSGSA